MARRYQLLGCQLAQHVLQEAAVVGEEARLRTTGSRVPAAPPRWRGGRASAL